MSIRPLPRKVIYTERDGKIKFKGNVVDEVYCNENWPWGDYKKMIQLIKQDKTGKIFFRFYYYVKKHNAKNKDYHSGAQATLILEEKNFWKIIEKAIKKWKKKKKKH